MAFFATNDTPTTQQWNEMAENALGTTTVASSNNINIGDDDYFVTITGTTPIQTITTFREGRKFVLYHDSAATDSLRLISGGNLVLPDAAGGTGGDYYLIPGTMVEMMKDTAGEFHIVGSSVISNSPQLRAYQAGNNSAISGVQQLELDTVSIDNYDGHNTTSFEYTVPYTGRYDMTAQTRYNVIASGEQNTTLFRVNGATVVRTTSTVGGTTETDSIAENSILLSQGDVVDITTNNSGATYTILGTLANTYMTLRWSV